MPQQASYAFDCFTLDPSVPELRREQSIVRLSRQAALLLVRLVEAQGRAVSASELLAARWSDTTVSEASLRQAICELRRALAPVASALQTVRGEGYRFRAAVAQCTPPRSPKEGPRLLGARRARA